MSGFEVMQRECDQCLMTPSRIVSATRMKALIRDCRQRDVSFECHKGTMAGRHIACHNHFMTGIGQMARIAGRLGALRWIDPETLKEVECDYVAL